MSQALCLVDRAMHAGSFRCVPYERCLYWALSSPFSRGRSIVQCSPSCALCVSPFSQHSVGSRLLCLRPRTRPPISLSFPSSFGDTTARTPDSSSGPPLLSFISPSAARAGSAPCFRSYLHSMHRLCIPSPLHPLPVCCAPPPFASIKYPWSLFFFFIPIPLPFGVELRDLVVIRGN